MVGVGRTDHFENVPLGLGMNREAMLASIRNGAEAGLGRDLLATQLAESEHVSQPPGSPGRDERNARVQRTRTDVPSETQRLSAASEAASTSPFSARLHIDLQDSDNTSVPCSAT